MKPQVLPDTNFLIYLAEYKKLHLLDELALTHDIVLLTHVFNELEKIALTGKYSDRQAAKLVLDFIEEMVKQNKLAVVEYAKNLTADQALLKYAITHKAYIATHDKALKQKARKHNIKILCLRNKAKLEEC